MARKCIRDIELEFERTYKSLVLTLGGEEEDQTYSLEAKLFCKAHELGSCIPCSN